MPEAVSRAAVITRGRPETIGPALTRLEAVAAEAGVELVLSSEELEKHDVTASDGDPLDADLVVVLGGDGTMLRALRRFLGTNIPAVGVNFGHVGFLTAISDEKLEVGLRRIFRGEYEVVELPTLTAVVGEEERHAVNDVVATSSTLGRMVELAWTVGGERLGTQHCDGLVCATPSGSTAYNLSNGGPVLVWGLDAMAVTFVAPHSLKVRPLVVPRGRDVAVTNETHGVGVTAVADGQVFAQLEPGDSLTVRLGPRSSLLATLPETTFFTRYRTTFAD